MQRQRDLQEFDVDGFRLDTTPYMPPLELRSSKGGSASRKIKDDFLAIELFCILNGIYRLAIG